MIQVIEPPPLPEPYQIRRGNLVTSDVTYEMDSGMQTSAPLPFAYTVKNVSGGYSLESSDFNGFVMVRVNSGTIGVPLLTLNEGAAVLISSSSGQVTIVPEPGVEITSANGFVLQQYERILLVREKEFDYWAICGLTPVGN